MAGACQLLSSHILRIQGTHRLAISTLEQTVRAHTSQSYVLVRALTRESDARDTLWDWSDAEAVVVIEVPDESTPAAIPPLIQSELVCWLYAHSRSDSSL